MQETCRRFLNGSFARPRALKSLGLKGLQMAHLCGAVQVGCSELQAAVAEARLVMSPIVAARHRQTVGAVWSWHAPFAAPQPCARAFGRHERFEADAAAGATSGGRVGRGVHGRAAQVGSLSLEPLASLPRWPRFSILVGAVVLLACGVATFTLRPTIQSDVQHLIEEDFTSNGDNNGKQFAGGKLPRPNRVLIG